MHSGLATGERVLVAIKAQAIILFGETAFLSGHVRSREKCGVENEQECTARTRAGRLVKAQQFLLAADVTCCAKSGTYYDGRDHNAVIALLAKVDNDTAGDQKRAGRAATALVSAAEIV